MCAPGTGTKPTTLKVMSPGSLATPHRTPRPLRAQPCKLASSRAPAWQSQLTSGALEKHEEVAQARLTGGRWGVGELQTEATEILGEGDPHGWVTVWED